MTKLELFKTDLRTALAQYPGLCAEWDTPDGAYIADSTRHYGLIARTVDSEASYEVFDMEPDQLGTFDTLSAALHFVLHAY